MTESEQEATDHLRTIRNLMERATVYRALSAPGALTGGLLALLVCGLLALRDSGQRLSTLEFMGVWLVVLAVLTGFNFWLLRRGALRRGEAFVSSGMRMALQAISPPMAAGFVLSYLSACYRQQSYFEMASYWMLFYGLGLLAMRSFAPKSLIALGGGFFTLGLAGFLPMVREWPGMQPYPLGILYMALSFGVLHLVYAASVWMARSPEDLPSPSPSQAGDPSGGAA